MLHPADPRLVVCIDGIVDPRLMAIVEQAARSGFWRVKSTGEWSVTIAPAEPRGRWNVEVKGGTGRHLFSVTGSATDLPDLIRDRIADAFARLESVRAR